LRGEGGLHFSVGRGRAGAAKRNSRAPPGCKEDQTTPSFLGSPEKITPMKSFYQEFKKFAVKGNMIDLAIGVIIGASFNNIVDVLVKKIITPPLGFLTSGSEMSKWELVVKAPVVGAEGTVTAPGIVIGYGFLVEALIDFFLVALTLFVVIKFINSLKDKAEDEANQEVPTPKDIQLLSEIRDEMKKMNGGEKSAA
jgi:large conductance mechanosensitive channel